MNISPQSHKHQTLQYERVPGAVVSPVLFCIYFAEHYNFNESYISMLYWFYFVGVLDYAYDIFLLAPSANATRNMLTICDNFEERYSVVFNASKSERLLGCVQCL